MKDRLVSVVIPLYNRKAYIGDAIDSLLCQSYENIEIIVVDDCSTDDGLSVVEGYRDTKIRLIKNEKNMGISYTRTRGLKEAKGEYIALLDSDDIAMPNRIEKQAAYLESNSKIGVVGSNRIEFYNGEDIGISKHWLEAEELKVALILDMPMSNPSLMMRREVVEEFSYDSDYIVAEDYEFLYRVSKKWDLVNLEEPLIKYRIHSGQITKNYDENLYLRNIKTRIFNELEIIIDDIDMDIYYRGINLKADPEELKRFTEIILEILLKNKELSIYSDIILRERLLGRLERIIKRELKGVDGLREQRKIMKLLADHGIKISSNSMRILTNILKNNK